MRRCDKTLLRTEMFSPYAVVGDGPNFILRMWDGEQCNEVTKKARICYQLDAVESDNTLWAIFCGDDFWCSAHTELGADHVLGELIAFLCLRFSDADSDYFESYTQTQMDFEAQHAEALQAEVNRWFHLRG